MKTYHLYVLDKAIDLFHDEVPELWAFLLEFLNDDVILLIIYESDWWWLYSWLKIHNNTFMSLLHRFSNSSQAASTQCLRKSTRDGFLEYENDQRRSRTIWMTHSIGWLLWIVVIRVVIRHMYYDKDIASRTAMVYKLRRSTGAIFASRKRIAISMCILNLFTIFDMTSIHTRCYRHRVALPKVIKQIATCKQNSFICTVATECFT
jgi:hypothetical protein